MSALPTFPPSEELLTQHHAQCAHPPSAPCPIDNLALKKPYPGQVARSMGEAHQVGLKGVQPRG